jgi:hypothetical protein
MRLPVKSLELVSVFVEASRNLKCKMQKTESTDLIFKTLEKIFHLVTLSL